MTTDAEREALRAKMKPLIEGGYVIDLGGGNYYRTAKQKVRT